MDHAKAPSDDLAFRVMNEIGIISQLGSTLFERVLPAGMTIAQFSVLNHFVRLGGPKRPTDLARAFQVAKATMTSTLGRLEGKGLVRIVADASDGRGRLVAITDEGRAMRDRSIAALGPALAELAERIGTEPLAAALEPLQAIRTGLDGMRSAP